MSSVSTWSRTYENLAICTSGGGRKAETYFFVNGPVLKRALDHVTHWRRPGFVFLSRHLSYCRGKVSTSMQLRSNYTTIAVHQNFNMCLPTEFTDLS